MSRPRRHARCAPTPQTPARTSPPALFPVSGAQDRGKEEGREEETDPVGAVLGRERAEMLRSDEEAQDPRRVLEVLVRVDDGHVEALSKAARNRQPRERAPDNHHTLLLLSGKQQAVCQDSRTIWSLSCGGGAPGVLAKQADWGCSDGLRRIKSDGQDSPCALIAPPPQSVLEPEKDENHLAMPHRTAKFCVIPSPIYWEKYAFFSPTTNKSHRAKEIESAAAAAVGMTRVMSNRCSRAFWNVLSDRQS
eukprot:2280126-Rhodomonas_salina.3